MNKYIENLVSILTPKNAFIVSGCMIGATLLYKFRHVYFHSKVVRMYTTIKSDETPPKLEIMIETKFAQTGGKYVQLSKPKIVSMIVTGEVSSIVQTKNPYLDSYGNNVSIPKYVSINDANMDTNYGFVMSTEMHKMYTTSEMLSLLSARSLSDLISYDI